MARNPVKYARSGDVHIAYRAYVGVACRQLERCKGREVDVAGDGLFAVASA